MLEKPDLQDEKTIACLRDEYEIRVAQVTFLPLGVDRNAAVQADYYQAMHKVERQQMPLSNSPEPVPNWPIYQNASQSAYFGGAQAELDNSV